MPFLTLLYQQHRPTPWDGDGGKGNRGGGQKSVKNNLKFLAIFLDTKFYINIKFYPTFSKEIK
jgi:hypothetical protein